jgi:hypothetical protein
MPDTYLAGVIDVAGCMLARWSARARWTARACAPGDAVAASPAAGSTRTAIARAPRAGRRRDCARRCPARCGGRRRLADALLAPHRWYGRALLPLAASGQLRAMAHVTGGGIAATSCACCPRAAARASRPALAAPGAVPLAAQAGSVPEEMRAARSISASAWSWSWGARASRPSGRARRRGRDRVALGDVAPASAAWSGRTAESRPPPYPGVTPPLEPPAPVVVEVSDGADVER